MRILALDPGSTQTGYVKVKVSNNFDNFEITHFGVEANSSVITLIDETLTHLLIEDYEARNNPYGKSSYSTVKFITNCATQAGRCSLNLKIIKNSVIRTHLNGRPNSSDKDTIKSLSETYKNILRSGAKVNKNDDRIKLNTHAWQAFAVFAYWYETRDLTVFPIHPKHPKYRANKS